MKPAGIWLPIGEFYRLVEPADVHSRQSNFEPGECRGVTGQNIDADERRAPRIVRKPFRPDRKHAVGPGEAFDEIVKGRPDRKRCALRRRHVAIHDDDCPRGQPGRQIGNQRARRTMTHHDRFRAVGHMLQKSGIPRAPGGRRRVMGQYVRHLDVASRRPQASAVGSQLDARTSGPATRMKCKDIAFSNPASASM